jgi:hypothetical protein
MGCGDVRNIKERSWIGWGKDKDKLCYAVEYGTRGVKQYIYTSKIKEITNIGDYKIFLTNSGTLYICTLFKDYPPTVSS